MAFGTRCKHMARLLNVLETNAPAKAPVGPETHCRLRLYRLHERQDGPMCLSE